MGGFLVECNVCNEHQLHLEENDIFDVSQIKEHNWNYKRGAGELKLYFFYCPECELLRQKMNAMEYFDRMGDKDFKNKTKTAVISEKIKHDERTVDGIDVVVKDPFEKFDRIDTKTQQKIFKQFVFRCRFCSEKFKPSLQLSKPNKYGETATTEKRAVENARGDRHRHETSKHSEEYEILQTKRKNRGSSKSKGSKAIWIEIRR